ncbi:hypothetical protein HDE79_000808 [Rhodanobacter sp. MP1X3]|nr:hypothetical protein [Rhodanobacter sp. MP1X3]
MGSRYQAGAAPQRYVETTSVTGTGQTPWEATDSRCKLNVHEPEYLPQPEAR